MVYKHLHHAFLFELLGGLIALFCVIAFGGKGVPALAVLALRPLILERSPNPPDERVWRLYYNAFKVSLFLTATTVVLTFFTFNFLSYNLQDHNLLLLTVVPWFFVIHGLVGAVLAWPHRANINREL